jgi:hypothetical protein
MENKKQKNSDKIFWIFDGIIVLICAIIIGAVFYQVYSDDKENKKSASMYKNNTNNQNSNNKKRKVRKKKKGLNLPLNKIVKGLPEPERSSYDGKDFFGYHYSYHSGMNISFPDYDGNNLTDLVIITIPIYNSSTPVINNDMIKIFDNLTGNEYKVRKEYQSNLSRIFRRINVDDLRFDRMKNMSKSELKKFSSKFNVNNINFTITLLPNYGLSNKNYLFILQMVIH